MEHLVPQDSSGSVIERKIKLVGQSIRLNCEHMVPNYGRTDKSHMVGYVMNRSVRAKELGA